MTDLDRILDEQRQAAEAVVNGGGQGERTWLDDLTRKAWAHVK